MRKFVGLLVMHVIRLVLMLRYRVTFKGLENLTKDQLSKPGGVLFLPNHPTIVVDPCLVVIGIYRKFPIRPLIVEYMYYSFGVHWLMRFMKGLPIPNLQFSANPLKRRRSQEALQKVVDGVKEGDNFLVYPGGKVKLSNYEMIGGASGVHSIVKNAPEANVVLVKTTGLYGSIFSSAETGKVKPMFPTLWEGVKILAKNLIFFTPRREVTIEYVPAPADLPREADKLTFNKYLEHWYNRPDDLDPELAKETLPGESLHLVPYYFWNHTPPKFAPPQAESGDFSLEAIPTNVQVKVRRFLAELAERDPDSLSPDCDLSSDLGLDSLDAADILAFLQEKFEVEGVPPSELRTVGRVMAIAAKEITFDESEEVSVGEAPKNWFEVAQPDLRCKVAPGDSIPEAFLNVCSQMGKRPACADDRAGVLTYSTLRIRAIALAQHIQKLEGDRIGVMLPSTIAASATILACQIAGKTPVMVNWTQGRRHLEQVVELSGIRHILSSWAFLDRLSNVDLEPVADQLVLLEDVKGELSLKMKLRAAWLAKRSPKQIFRAIGGSVPKKEDEAVLLFTSGTEGMPKGVPLTHENILSNQRAALECLHVKERDVLFAILPPFHAFGFTISSLIGLVSGLRTVYYADPTNGKQMARGFAKWDATIVCGAPTFLKAMLRAAQPEEMQTMHYCITGAEKAPPELFRLCERFGIADTVIEGYGITECAPILTLNYPGEDPVGVGRALLGVELLVVQEQSHEPLSTGERGLVLARGPNVFSGYLNPGIASPFVEVNGKKWYSTGDLGHLDDQERLTLSGRLKRFIKIGGEMVSLGAIEDAVLESAESKGWEIAEDTPNVAVVADEEDGERPRIHLFARFKMNVEEVNEALRSSGMSNLVRVSEVKQLDEIPVMGSGKVHYRELQKLV